MNAEINAHERRPRISKCACSPRQLTAAPVCLKIRSVLTCALCCFEPAHVILEWHKRSHRENGHRNCAQANTTCRCVRGEIGGALVFFLVIQRHSHAALISNMAYMWTLCIHNICIYTCTSRVWHVTAACVLLRATCPRQLFLFRERAILFALCAHRPLDAHLLRARVRANHVDTSGRRQTIARLCCGLWVGVEGECVWNMLEKI